MLSPPIVLLVLCAPVTPSLAAGTDCPADPFADPANDHCNPLRYIPSMPANAAATGLYFIVAAALTWRLFRYKTWYLSVLVLGTYTEAAGLAARLAVRSKPQVLGAYIGMNTLVVLSPCLFLAADYIILGRIVQHLNGDHWLRPLKGRVVSRVFIISDVLTFLIQAAGGGLSASGSPSSAKLGGHIFLAGLILQLISFAFFTIIAIIFFFRVMNTSMWQVRQWKSLYYALLFTCVCFLVRSVFRCIELGQGYVGYLATHEPYFLLLDTLPLWLGITTYVFFWPGKYLTPENKSRVEPVRPSQERLTSSNGKGDGNGYELPVLQTRSEA